MITLVLGAVLGLGIALVSAACRYRPQPRTAPPVPAGPEPDTYVPCHATACAHLERPHDRTTAGLTCRRCGTVTIPEAPRA